MNDCEFCGKTFSTKYNLSVHQKQTKYCLKIQKELARQIYYCQFCDSELESQEEQDCHHCYRKTLYLESQLEIFKARVQDLEERNNQLREDLVTLYERPTNSTTINNNKVTNRVSNVNNDHRVNAIINNFEPITMQHLEEQAQFLTIDHIKKGPQGYAQFILDNPLKDRAICVDFARRKIKYKGADGEVVCDPEMTGLLKSLFTAIEGRNSELVDSCMGELRHKLAVVSNGGGDELNEDELLILNMQTDAIIDTITSITDYKLHVKKMAQGDKPAMYNEITKNVCSAMSNMSRDSSRLIEM